MEVRFLKLKEVMHLTGLSKAGIYQKIGHGEFPQQYALGGRNVAWLSTDIDSWINEQIEAATPRPVRPVGAQKKNLKQA